MPMLKARSETGLQRLKYHMGETCAKKFQKCDIKPC